MSLLNEHTANMDDLRADSAALQNKLSPEEIKVIQELRKIQWGKLAVIKKDGKVVMITPAHDILMSKE